MSARSQPASMPSVELFVLQHRGQEVNHCWEWTQGPDTQTLPMLRPAHQFPTQVGFDTILSGVPGLDADTLQQAAFCTLHRMGSPQQAVWVMGNSGHSLACSVNARMLATGSQLRLEHGDEIELGLTRLLVSLEPSHEMPGRADTDLPQRSSLPPSPERADALPGFALTDLDAPPESATLIDPQHQGLKRSDIGDLISLDPEVSVPDSAPPTALATPYGGTPTPELQPIHAPSVQPAQTALSVAEHATSYAESASSLQATLLGRANRPERVGVAATDPLGDLHARYLDKLRNPTRADVGDAWQNLVRGDQARQVDPVQHWMKAAGSRSSLDDLLGQQHGIDSVIQGLDPLGGADVLAPESFDSVMHLFAPDGLRAPVQESLQKLVQHSLPGLTQREHHSMSLDSAMPFTGGEHSAAPSPPQIDSAPSSRT